MLGIASVGVMSTGAGAQSDQAPGVSAKEVKIGYVSSQTGVAAATHKNAHKACQARVDAENAKGGVNGRKIDLIVIDDKSGAGNVTATKDLVENQGVFALGCVILKQGQVAWSGPSANARQEVLDRYLGESADAMA